MTQGTEKKLFPSSQLGNEFLGSYCLCSFHVLGNSGDQEHEQTGRCLYMVEFISS